MPHSLLLWTPLIKFDRGITSWLSYLFDFCSVSLIDWHFLCAGPAANNVVSQLNPSVPHVSHQKYYQNRIDVKNSLQYAPVVCVYCV